MVDIVRLTVYNGYYTMNKVDKMQYKNTMNTVDKTVIQGENI